MIAKNEERRIRKILKNKDNLPSVFDALSDSTRYKMVKILLTNSNVCLNVSDIAEILNISVPAVSQHFKILEYVGLVKRERRGLNICYKINREDRNVTCTMNIILKQCTI